MPPDRRPEPEDRRLPDCLEAPRPDDRTRAQSDRPHVKRGWKHGVRIVGSLKSNPGLNVLAIYEK
jgi:hypothetical protein